MYLNDSNVSTMLERLNQSLFHEDFSKLRVGKRKRPETQVRRSIRDTSENKLNSFDHLMYKDFTGFVALV